MNAAQLKPCPNTPNCVSTEATDRSHAIAPYRYQGAPAAALRRLHDVVLRVPRAKIVAADATSLRVEFRTALFGFVDDATFVVDDASKTIRFRSASRVGRSDLGVNRRRMEAIRREFAK
jgi:uncharacterized protein (DUF1499 family)